MDIEKFEMLVAFEIAQNAEDCMWLSLSSTAGFQGVVILMTYGPAHAITLLKELDIVPLGEVQCSRAKASEYGESDFNRLLDLDELIELGYVEKRVIH